MNTRNVLLTVIAILLAGLLLRPALQPPAVQAVSDRSYLYLEPGVTTIRPVEGLGQTQGKVMIDLRTGDVWGFPTESFAPYPALSGNHETPVSKPIYMGRFDFDAMKRP